MGYPSHGLLSCLLVFLTLMSSVVSDAANSYCSPEIPDPNDPPKPKLDYSYSTQIVGKRIHSRRTETIHEYYDRDLNKMSYDITKVGAVTSMIVDITANTWITIRGTNRCTVRRNVNITDITDNGERFVDITFNTGHVWKYKGKTSIRGVSVERWRACGTGPLGKYNFTSDYYFTEPDSSGNRIPYRMNFIGVKERGLEGGHEDFHAIYDYFLFSKSKPPAHVFKPLPGVVCKNVTSVVTPPLVMAATFRMEIINPGKKTVKSLRVVFDKQLQLSLEIFDRRTRVNDFTRGIQYKITGSNGECTRKALTRLAGPDKRVGVRGMIHMATLRRFLYDDGEFTYNGVYHARGIPCDVYTKLSDAAESVEVDVIEMYVARPNVKITNNEGTVLSSLQQPVRIVMKGGKDLHHLAVKFQFEIYDFDPQNVSYVDPFDLTPCFSQQQTIAFEMELQGGRPTKSMHVWSVFKRKLATTISYALRISFLRVRIQDVIFGEYETKVRGLLFEADQPYMRFTVFHNKRLKETLKSFGYFEFTNQTNTPKLCAFYCEIPEKRPFDTGYQTYPAFEFDRSTKKCTFYIYNAYSVDDKVDNLIYSSTIDFYTEATDANFYSQPMAEAWVDLQRLVGKGLLSITYDNQNVLKATSVTRRNPEDDENILKNRGEDNPLKQFTETSGEISSGPVEVLKGVFIIDACARHCLHALTYDCEALVYDYRSRQCNLYDTNTVKEVYRQKSSTKRTKHTFTRNYLASFEKIPGRSVLSPLTDAVYSSVVDDNACAGLCAKESDFYCQSFEMCGQACLLGRKHIFNTPPGQAKEDYSWDHFSRAYIQDYSKTNNNKVFKTPSSVIERGGIGVKECATLCSTSPSFDCDQFQFCDSDSLCRMTTNPSKNSHVLYADSGSCDLYSRKTNRRRVVISLGQTSASAGGHSTGSMGGVAIGMILLGTLAMAVGILVFLRLRSPGRGPQRLSAGFSRSQMNDEYELGIRK